MRLLHLDHLGAEIRQMRCGERSGDHCAGVQHAQSLPRPLAASCAEGRREVLRSHADHPTHPAGTGHRSANAVTCREHRYRLHHRAHSGCGRSDARPGGTRLCPGRGSSSRCCPAAVRRGPSHRRAPEAARRCRPGSALRAAAPPSARRCSWPADLRPPCACRYRHERAAIRPRSAHRQSCVRYAPRRISAAKPGRDANSNRTARAAMICAPGAPLRPGNKATSIFSASAALHNQR